MSNSAERKVLLPGVSLETITPPALPSLLLPRTHLLDFLNQPAPRALIIMTPSGYGKTTLAAQWAATNPQTVWFSSLESDDIKTTLNRMVSALRRVFPDFAPWFIPSSVTITNLEETIKKITVEIAEYGDVVNFVLDNLEKMPNSNSPFVQMWADNLPLNVRTLSLRKNPPMNSYARATDLGVLKYLTAFDMAFTQAEIEELSCLFGVDIEQTETRKFLEMLSGWPSGVRLILELLTHESEWELLKSHISTKVEPQLHKQTLSGVDVSETMSISELVGALAEKVLGGPISRGRNVLKLTEREMEILRLLASSLTLPEIAEKSHLSKNTIKSHLKNIYRKLDVDSRDKAVQVAKERSMI